MAGEGPLDQYSISQKASFFCDYGAPYIAFIKDGKCAIQQACCNHWNCRRCTLIMAAQVRRRAVLGSEMFAAKGVGLYFWTFTLRGLDLELATADEHYYEWTNKALSRLRAAARKDGAIWAYVQITERQKRGAAHSHFIHTFRPRDAVNGGKRHGHQRLASLSFLRAVVDAGLGPQCDITVIDEPGAVASYISGYLNKHAVKDWFPPKWKRVRWSREWPDLPPEDLEYAKPLMKKNDWTELDAFERWWEVDSQENYEYVRRRMTHVRVKALVDMSTI